MTIIDEVRDLALKGYGAEDVSVILGRKRITTQEAWRLIRFWSDIYGRTDIEKDRNGADRGTRQGERVDSGS